MNSEASFRKHQGLQHHADIMLATVDFAITNVILKVFIGAPQLGLLPWLWKTHPPPPIVANVKYMAHFSCCIMLCLLAQESLEGKYSLFMGTVTPPSTFRCFCFTASHAHTNIFVSLIKEYGRMFSLLVHALFILATGLQ